MAEEERKLSEQVKPDKKAELEEQKLRLEILELEKVWYKKPTFFVPLGAAISSLIILGSTGFFNTKIESLNNSIDKLNVEKERLTIVKGKLTRDSLKLEQSKKVLQSDLQMLRDSLNLATRPVIEIKLHKVYNEEDIGIYVTNTGTGTAYFKQINFYYKGLQIFPDKRGENFFENVISSMGLSPSWLTWEGKKVNENLNKSETLATRQNYATLKIARTHFESEYIIKFLEAIKDLRIEIEYQSSNGKSYWAKKTFEMATL